MSEPKPAATTDNPWVRLSRDVVYENPWIRLYHDEVTQPDGQPGIYGVVHFRSRAVGVVALDEDDRILLVGQYRYTLDEYSWELPEGGGRFDETPLEAIQRELLEETGYSATNWEEILRTHLSNSVSDEAGYCYLATGLVAGTACPEGTEQLQVRWVPFDEAYNMVLRFEMTDSLTVMGILRVALMRADGQLPR